MNGGALGGREAMLIEWNSHETPARLMNSPTKAMISVTSREREGGEFEETTSSERDTTATAAQWQHSPCARAVGLVARIGKVPRRWIRFGWAFNTVSCIDRIFNIIFTWRRRNFVLLTFHAGIVRVSRIHDWVLPHAFGQHARGGLLNAVAKIHYTRLNLLVNFVHFRFTIYTLFVAFTRVVFAARLAVGHQDVFRRVQHFDAAYKRKNELSLVDVP